MYRLFLEMSKTCHFEFFFSLCRRAYLFKVILWLQTCDTKLEMEAIEEDEANKHWVKANSKSKMKIYSCSHCTLEGQSAITVGRF